MYDPECGWSLSFGGSGFLGLYYVGVTHCLSERAPYLLHNARMILGSSAGALHAATFLSGIPLDRVLQIIMDLTWKARRQNLGVLHPSFNMGKYLRDDLQEHLPDNVHQLISGKIGISLTRVSDRRNVLVSDFQSKAEVVDALLCSCFIPFYCGLIPPAFRGVRYIDGGFSDNLPLADVKTTITVCPFYGEFDICPKIKSTNFLHVNVTNVSFHLCLRNFHLLSRSLFFPPGCEMMRETCLHGYLDACRFLEENGISDRPQLCPSLSSEEKEPEAILPCWEDQRQQLSLILGLAEGEELMERLSTLPWDEHILDTLSPRLAAGLAEATRDRGGYLSRLSSLLPVWVMYYVMLPVELAVALLHRLLIWLPNSPDDFIQWLQWATSQVCARLMTCLLPSSRFQRPASGQPVPSHPAGCSSADL
ncbi:1-acylglycerol-3-phosphate O-acyltransferase PNPLA3 isoform X2 [Ictidomys tridecemlineatus]|uniref:triacylglycerol lipase n=1 Tax=Ictidomys tridecemlineatus TaxID=43179 RepID=I3MM73_ICTTR|nr:1-acylglycerol-3-phosphate O-acyltransferase PNPLA3 [Ictidomys tridecemlineatus]KAG3290772.1 patatin like phospholipase domain containing 3, transcript variant X1 [Ictidomys tridecemlineatus]